jgi:vitamin K-dependent gamma-carboxylase
MAVFRIAFGVAVTVNSVRYITEFVHEYYIEPEFHFSYGRLDFVEPLPGSGMYAVYGAMAATGIMIAIGWSYRIAAWSFFVLTTYVFLIDSTYYQNHEYLISLLALMLALLPAQARWSLDARRRPERSSNTVAAWNVWLLRFQIGVPYFFGGVAKINTDWLHGEPLRIWLANRSGVPAIHAVLTNETVVWMMTYGALALDLSVVWLLLYRRTRLPAFVIVTCFHVMNAWLFGLHIFPWLMIGATTIYFAPAWPEQLGRRLFVLTGRFGRARERPEAPVTLAAPSHPALVAFFAVWVVIQVVVPLRHYITPGPASWTEAGHRFAWHMRLRHKVGTATFEVTTDDRTWVVDLHDFLSDKQARLLVGNPERLAQFARHLSDEYGEAQVRVETAISLNTRQPQPIVDSSIDLASQRLPWWRTPPWVVPLETPLQR